MFPIVEPIDEPAREQEPAPVLSESLPPYEECRPVVPSQRELLQLSHSEMAAIAASVVKAEGPIHPEEVARRIREASGLERTGNRILNKINQALRVAENRGEIVSEEGFWSGRERTHALPRNRRDAALPLRRADRIAPHEYRLAILKVVETAAGIERKDLIVETARLIGFDRTGTDLQVAIDRQMTVLLEARRLTSDNGHIRFASDNQPAGSIAEASAPSLA